MLMHVVSPLQSLFQYDDKLISSLERPKPCADHPIKFLSRTFKYKLRFKIDLGQQVSAQTCQQSQTDPRMLSPPLRNV